MSTRSLETEARRFDISISSAQHFAIEGRLTLQFDMSAKQAGLEGRHSILGDRAWESSELFVARLDEGKGRLEEGRLEATRLHCMYVLHSAGGAVFAREMLSVAEWDIKKSARSHLEYEATALLAHCARLLSRLLRRW